MDKTSPILANSTYYYREPIMVELSRAEYLERTDFGLYLQFKTNGVPLQTPPDLNGVVFLHPRYVFKDGKSVQLTNPVTPSGDPNLKSSLTNLAVQLPGLNRESMADKFVVQSRFALQDEKVSANGPIYMHTNVSLNNCWPVPIRTLLRPEWMSRPSSSLNVLSSEVLGNILSLQVRYNGTKKITIPPLGTTFAGSRLEDMWHTCFTSRDDSNPKEAKLLARWSEHLEFANGTPTWVVKSKSPSTFSKWDHALAVNLISAVEQRPGEFKLTYEINRPNSGDLAQPIRVVGKIGITGDGFVPFSIPLPIPAKTNGTSN